VRARYMLLVLVPKEAVKRFGELLVSCLYARCVSVRVCAWVSRKRDRGCFAEALIFGPVRVTCVHACMGMAHRQLTLLPTLPR
jgi:hypothetical protein